MSRLAVIVRLAITTTGAACVPIYTSYPGERLQEILSGLGCSIVLSSFEKALSLSTKNIEFFIVDEDSILNIAGTKDANQSVAKPKDLALVVYTFGTTGKPKGIALSTARYAPALSMMPIFLVSVKFLAF
jgi:non-ribosomal peptide synthetase component F